MLDALVARCLTCVTLPAMKKIQILFHDAGGGHRNAALALQAIATQQRRDWDMQLIQFQELTNPLDLLRKLTGIQIQEQYNILLRNGWTMGATQILRLLQATIRLFHGQLVNLLAQYFRRNPADLLVSVIPHFNREIGEAWSAVYPERPFVTLITDLADFPPRFWIEPISEQYVICGTEKAVQQAREIGKDESHILKTSGMILRPDFYFEENVDPVARRKEMGLEENLATGILLFGGFGSKVMYEIAERLETARTPVQLIVVCGRNEQLKQRFLARKWNFPVCTLGFTNEVHRLMRLADFLIGKPGPGSIAEAMVRKLPVILECNSRTLPQERYNTEWVKEKQLGIVLNDFSEIAQGVNQLLEPSTLARLRSHVAALDNRAIFEIPELFAKLLTGETRRETQSSLEAPYSSV